LFDYLRKFNNEPSDGSEIKLACYTLRAKKVVIKAAPPLLNCDFQKCIAQAKEGPRLRTSIAAKVKNQLIRKLNHRQLSEIAHYVIVAYFQSRQQFSHRS
jgi:hypothetical protein